MTVVAIHIGPGAASELSAVESVSAVAGKGLEGDRHFHAAGAEPGDALTIVEEEEVAAVGLPPALPAGS